MIGNEGEELVVGPDLTRLQRDELNIGFRQTLQDLVRPDDVESGDAVEQEANDVHDELLSNGKGSEAISIFGGARTHAPGKRPAQRLARAEARGAGDVVDV